jgi:hypothetical protein
MSDAAPRTYFWDFFGPRSQPTASHFKRHLQGFLEQHGIGHLPLVEASSAPGHHGVGVTAPPEHWPLIEKALRPKRFEPRSPAP